MAEISHAGEWRYSLGLSHERKGSPLVRASLKIRGSTEAADGSCVPRIWAHRRAPSTAALPSIFELYQNFITIRYSYTTK
jgi:hypothetical protein